MAHMTLSEALKVMTSTSLDQFPDDDDWLRRVDKVRELRSPLYPLIAPVHAPWANDTGRWMKLMMERVYCRPNPIFDSIAWLTGNPRDTAYWPRVTEPQTHG